MTNQAILSAGPSDMPVDMTRVDRMTASLGSRGDTPSGRGKSVALAALRHRRWASGWCAFGASFSASSPRSSRCRN